MIEQLTAIIESLAQAELVSRFQHGAQDGEQALTWHSKRDGSGVTEADNAMQDRLQAELQHHWPQIAFIGEEMPGAEQQRILASLNSRGENHSSQNACWCLDPLDGTTNFASGVPFFSVSLALIEHGQVSLGIVYDPIRRECFSAYRGGGAYLNGKIVTVPESVNTPVLSDMVAVVDIKRLPKPLARNIAMLHPFRSQRNFGSGALDWCWLAVGRFQLYLHGGQKLWDYAAGRLILETASGVVSTLDGEVDFNIDLKTQAVVAATNQQQYQLWYRWIVANKN
ncbi:MAG: inositol monophosphatase family protein [Gammaproteobacteria bacterium]|nr:inositol monophosphatase family protein [Gammaproteobacteria bacterium]